MSNVTFEQIYVSWKSLEHNPFQDSSYGSIGMIIIKTNIW